MAMFSQRHYNALARYLVYSASEAVIAQHVSLLPGIRHTAEVLAKELAKDNPRFKRHVFLNACGVANGETSK